MNELSGTMWQELLKNIILSFSGLGLGAALYMVGYDIRRAMKTHGHARRLWAARALFAASFLGIIALLSDAIYRRPEPLPLEWRIILYTILIVGAALSALGIAWETKKVKKEDL